MNPSSDVSAHTNPPLTSHVHNLMALIAPLTSIMILVLGAGFYTTYTSVHLQNNGVANWMVGLVSSAYFSGFIISAFKSQHFIFRVGHIRAFSAFAASIATVTIIQGLFFSPTLWIAIRFVSGFCLAGICVVIESWLMASSSEVNRGMILSIYMIAYYLAQAIGQMFMKIPYTHVLIAYCLIAMLASLSLLPVTLTRFTAPSPENPKLLSFKYLYKKVPLGVIGCFISGIILGPLYTLVPVYLQENAKPENEVGWVMMAMILGGTLLQYPIGKLSDRMDRRKVLIAMCFFSVIVFLLFIPDIYDTLWLAVLGFFIGAATFVIYPLAISYTIDQVDHTEMVSAIATLVLSYGMGSTIGPLLPAAIMDWMGPNGLCYFLLVASVYLLGYTTYRTYFIKLPKEQLLAEAEHVQTNFIAITRTTPEAIQGSHEQTDTTPSS